METRVIHVKHAPNGWKSNPLYVYIGRQGMNGDGYFGNPFPLSDNGGEAERNQVCNWCQAHFEYRFETDLEFRDRLIALHGKILVCYCKPLRCHGDGIVSILNRYFAERTPKDRDEWASIVAEEEAKRAKREAESLREFRYDIMRRTAKNMARADERNKLFVEGLQGRAITLE